MSQPEDTRSAIEEHSAQGRILKIAKENYEEELGYGAIVNFLHDPDVESILACADSSAALCGHDERYCYTEDGGKNITCLLCEHLRTRSQSAEPSVTSKEWQALVDAAREEGRLAGRNEVLRSRLDAIPSSTAEPAAYMIRWKGCASGPVETVFETALQKARESIHGADVVPLYFAPSATEEYQPQNKDLLGQKKY